MKIRIVAIDQLYVDFVFGRVAQWLEHHSYKMGVDSSILSTPTQKTEASINCHLRVKNRAVEQHRVFLFDPPFFEIVATGWMRFYSLNLNLHELLQENVKFTSNNPYAPSIHCLARLVNVELAFQVTIYGRYPIQST